MNPASLHSLNRDALAAWLGERGQPAFRTGQILNWLYEKRANSVEEMSNLPAPLRTELAAAFRLEHPELVRTLGAGDTTRKFLLRLTDGAFLETVLIPASPALYGEGSSRRTLCVSSQVGCAFGCKFCASGLDGLQRNLEPGEIVAQLLRVEELSGEKVNNVVFMGMGEPLANMENVLRAIEILHAPWGVGLGARHITLSTCGLAPQIRQLAAQPLQTRLAVSLHGATDAVRSQIMPINRRFPLAELLAACEDYAARKKQKITLEYILIQGLNDTAEQAKALGKIARRLGAKINVIPYNEIPGLTWKRPTSQQQASFMSQLKREKTDATLRREKGTDIQAACGQLRLQTRSGSAMVGPD